MRSHWRRWCDVDDAENQFPQIRRHYRCLQLLHKEQYCFDDVVQQFVLAVVDEMILLLGSGCYNGQVSDMCNILR